MRIHAYATTATITAAAAALAAVHWRSKSRRLSQPELDQMIADSIIEVSTVDPDTAVSEYASVFVVRGLNPPDPRTPWYAHASWTAFEDDADGLRVVHSRDLWCSTRTAGWDLVQPDDEDTHVRWVDSELEF